VSKSIFVHCPGCATPFKCVYEQRCRAIPTPTPKEPPFAKIVEVDGRQVLFYIESDTVYDGKAKVNQIVRVDGLEINAALHGLTYEQADEILAERNEDSARAVVAFAQQILLDSDAGPA
jgi:hypothetical protein